MENQTFGVIQEVAKKKLWLTYEKTANNNITSFNNLFY